MRNQSADDNKDRSMLALPLAMKDSSFPFDCSQLVQNWKQYKRKTLLKKAGIFCL